MSAIEWTDKSWGPLTGFSESGAASFLPDRLEIPLGWREPCRVRVCPGLDLFHEFITDEQIAAVYGVMAACPQHEFQVLTKRPGVAREWFHSMHDQPGTGQVFHHQVRGCMLALLQNWPRGEQPDLVMNRTRHLVGGDCPPWPLPNVWLGTSIEDQATADERVPELLACPAAVRFLSIEPMLGPVDLEPAWLAGEQYEHSEDCEDDLCALAGGYHDCRGRVVDYPRLHWLILGAESGPGARPCEDQWMLDVIEQARSAGVPVFVKQRCKNGRKIPFEEWPEELQVREWPKGGDDG